MSSHKSRVAVPPARTVAVREIHLIDREKEMEILREAADSAVRAIVGIFEGEINIYKKKTRKFLKIEKMTNQKYSKKELSLQEEKL